MQPKYNNMSTGDSM